MPNPKHLSVGVSVDGFEAPALPDAIKDVCVSRHPEDARFGAAMKIGGPTHSAAMQAKIDEEWAKIEAGMPPAPYGGKWVPHVEKIKIEGATRINITAKLQLPQTGESAND